MRIGLNGVWRSEVNCDGRYLWMQVSRGHSVIETVRPLGSCVGDCQGRDNAGSDFLEDGDAKRRKSRSSSSSSSSAKLKKEQASMRLRAAFVGAQVKNKHGHTGIVTCINPSSVTVCYLMSGKTQTYPFPSAFRSRQIELAQRLDIGIQDAKQRRAFAYLRSS